MAKERERIVDITLPLPMSVNRLYMYNKYTHQKIYKREAVEWLDKCALIVASKMRGLEPISDYTPVHFGYTLGNRNADSHNLLKLLCDVLEKGGFVTNDKFIMVQTDWVKFDPGNPHVFISATLETKYGSKLRDEEQVKGNTKKKK